MRPVLLAAALCALVVPLTAVADNEPVITVPPDMIVEADSFSGATVTFVASAVDSDGQPMEVTCAPASGTIFGFGETTVTCTARGRGPTATKRFHVTVVDTRPPAVTVPAAVRVSTTRRAGRAVEYRASANDVVDGPVAVDCVPAPGTVFAIGRKVVTCSAVDARGNASSATFAVTVVFVAARTAKSAALLSPRAGATIRSVPMLRWRADRKARFYNVQVFRGGHKILSAWPSRPRFRMHGRWTFGGDEYRLRAGRYTWLVWPAYGTPASPRYGKLLGLSSFRFA